MRQLLKPLRSRRLRDPAIDDPEHDDAEPQLTDEDLSGRADAPIETHIALGDDTP